MHYDDLVQTNIKGIFNNYKKSALDMRENNAKLIIAG